MSLSNKFSIGAVALAGILCNQRVEGNLDKRDCIYGSSQRAEVEDPNKRKTKNYSFEGEQVKWCDLMLAPNKQHNDKKVDDCDVRVHRITEYYQDVINQKDRELKDLRNASTLTLIGTSLLSLGIIYANKRKKA
ncbi:MAG: hypothetical protein AABY10_00195 [Nanoarchaeota archaeon]